MRKKILLLISTGLVSLSSFAALDFELIDFKDLGAKNGQPLDASLIMEAIRGTEGVVKSISCENARYATGSNLTGVWFDSPSEDNIGSITIEINPAKFVKVDHINIYGSKAKDLIGQTAETPVILTIDGQNYNGNFANKTASTVAAFASPKLGDEIIKTFTIAFPYTENNPYKEYSGCLQSIRIYYTAVEDEDKEAVSEWKFAKDSDKGYLDTEYIMPTLNAIPSIAAELAQYSSSDEDVANFEDGNLKLKSTGTTTIKANLGENMLFRPSNEEASYLLTVENSSGVSTICPDLPEDPKDHSSKVFNLQGAEVSGALLSSGLFLVKDSNGKYRKILVK